METFGIKGAGHIHKEKDSYFEELSRWAESDALFDALDSSPSTADEDWATLRHVQAAARRQLGK